MLESYVIKSLIVHSKMSLHELHQADRQDSQRPKLTMIKTRMNKITTKIWTDF